MTGRGRRIAVVLAVLAVVLSVGRWGAVFLTERLWEASVSEAVAVAGARRALLTLALELLVLLVSAGWFVANLTIAARSALPDRHPPERQVARIWPAQIPRWSLTLTALVIGVLLGGGGGAWLDHILLIFDGVRFAIPDPLLGSDLAAFLRDYPLWSELQSRAALLVGVALGCVALLHAAGGTIRFIKRRIWVTPRARGHLALLLSVLALVLAWGCTLEPFRLAAGLRGPLLPSEFLLRRLVAGIEAGLGAATAVISFLWWLRARGLAAFVLWALFGVGLLAGRWLPLHGTATTADPQWQSSARRLDSVAFATGGAEAPESSLRTSAASLHPSLWDGPVLETAVADSGATAGVGRGWITVTGVPRAVWFVVREPPGEVPTLLALSDDRVSPSGGPLFWTEGDSTPSPEPRAFRELPAHSIRPGAPAVDLGNGAHGVTLDGWARRLMVAWAMQVPGALSSRSGTRVDWRLDPGVRVRAVAPFAQWGAPRLRQSGSRFLWESDGFLSSALFPSSTRVAWSTGEVSMVRPTFLSLVDLETGGVRIFRRDPSDSLGAAWARITAPLIEAPGSIPAELRNQDLYPPELILVQARVLAGPAWRLGRIPPGADDTPTLPGASTSDGEVVVPFTADTVRTIRAVLLARRTSSGDSLQVVRLDSLNAPESAERLVERWAQFPFLQSLRDSVKAAGATPLLGHVRFVETQEGLVGFQPGWAVAQSGGVRLISVSIALGKRLGAGRTVTEAWMNLRGEIAPRAGGTAQEVLEKARRWMQHADSALKRGDLQELGRALAYLRELLGPPREK